MTKIHISYGPDKVREMHLKAEDERAACGKDPAGLYLVTDPDKVTCEDCKDSLKA